MNRKRRVCVVMVLFSLLFGFSSVVTADNNTLIIGGYGEALGLDPRMETDVPSFQRINVMMEPLVKFNVDMEIAPGLAKSWHVSDDTMTLRFVLQDGVKWHDGVPFTADDVVYTFEWVLNADNGAPNRGLYVDIDRIEVVSDTEVVFHLKQPNSFLLNNIARMPITPRHDGDRNDFRQNPIGTGPYKLVSWSRDDRMIFVENEEYWGGRPNVHNLVFRTIPEDATRLLALEAQEIDFYQGNVVGRELERLEADPTIIVQRAPGTGYEYLGFNTQVEALSDIRVRQAFCYLIDREAVVARILWGVGSPGVGPVSEALPWFNPDVQQYEYNPERAKELLAEAGYGPGDLKLTLHTDERATRSRVAEMIQHEAEKIGVEIEVILEEWGAYLTRIQQTGDFELFLLGWAGQLDPDRAMIRQFSTEGANNYGKYSNERVDYLLNLGRTVPPESQESLDIYGEAQEIIVREAPYAFTNYSAEVGLNHPWIGNWEVHPYAAGSYQNAHLITKNK
jgi:peptide/nickel transport system substrate-binding protein